MRTAMNERRLIIIPAYNEAANLPRVLPAGLGALIRRDSWAVPPICELLAASGGHWRPSWLLPGRRCG